MEAYSSSSSSSSTTFLSSQTPKLPNPCYHSSLHTVKKSPSKPWKKPPVAPLPPIRPRVYKVDPINFRDLVQKLTSAPEFQSQQQQQRLQSVAPPPLNVYHAATAPAPAPPLFDNKATQVKKTSTHPFSAVYQELMSDTVLELKPMSDSTYTDSHLLGMNLSPSSYNWCSFPLLSPGTLSSLEQSTVL